MATSLAILPSASNLMTTYEYSQWTTRGKSELTIVPESKAEVADIEQEGLDGDYILDYNYGAGSDGVYCFPMLAVGQVVILKWQRQMR